jgi:hypothetical protein
MLVVDLLSEAVSYSMKINNPLESLKTIRLVLSLIVISYLFGAFSYSRNLWPIELLRQIKDSGEAYATAHPNRLAQVDSLKRLTFFPGKIQVECPVQAKDTGVFLILGQSNAANHAEKKYTTQYPGNVVNYFDGKCYVASSPLLGATGEGGEFITPLADQLMANGTYKKIIIIAAAVGGSPISRWQRDGDLNELLIGLINEVQRKFHITDVIWHQGETDANPPYRTTTKIYLASFQSLLNSLTALEVRGPIFISIATRLCDAHSDWREDNPVATAQNMLIDNKRIFLGADTDKLVERQHRYNGCHFDSYGQSKTAEAFANSITAVHKHTRISSLTQPL